MITEENKAIVRRYFEEVLNQRHLSSIDALFAPHFVSHPTGADVHATVGLNTYVQAIAHSHAAFPDLHVTIEAQIAEADLVATRWKAHGTRRGIFGNLPPTDKEVTATAMHFHRLEQGNIGSNSICSDCCSNWVPFPKEQLSQSEDTTTTQHAALSLATGQDGYDRTFGASEI